MAGAAPRTRAKSDVLVAVRDPPMCSLIQIALTANNYRVREAATASEALDQVAASDPDVVLVDLGLPDFGCLELIRRLREWGDVPVLLVSARGEEGHDVRVRGLGEGADGFLGWPFSAADLIAHLRLVLRRKSGATATIVRFGEVSVDLKKRIVHRRGKEVRLAPLECKILFTLVRHAGLPMTYRRLHELVWSVGHPHDRWLRVYMWKLRQKLERDPANPRYLLTERGLGYRLRVE